MSGETRPYSALLLYRLYLTPTLLGIAVIGPPSRTGEKEIAYMTARETFRTPCRRGREGDAGRDDLRFGSPAGETMHDDGLTSQLRL